MLALVGANSAYAAPELAAAINAVRKNCSNISSELNSMKTMAGINTAVTGVGTVAGGVAVGTGIAKSVTDSEIDKLEQELENLKKSRGNVSVETLTIQNQTEFNQQLSDFIASYKQKEQELSDLEQKSKNLGNWRTGMLATSSATSIAGTVMATNNRLKGDLKSQIDACLNSISILSDARMQAHVSGTATSDEIAHADNIIHACTAWHTVDLNNINKRSSGAAVSGGLGIGLGVAGTIVSATANSDSVRQGENQKEKNLNTAANVLAGGTTVASGAATIFNATQISAIKRAASVADECEEALK